MTVGFSLLLVGALAVGVVLGRLSRVGEIREAQAERDDWERIAADGRRLAQKSIGILQDTTEKYLKLIAEVNALSASMNKMTVAAKRTMASLPRTIPN